LDSSCASRFTFHARGNFFNRDACCAGILRSEETGCPALPALGADMDVAEGLR